MITEIAEIQVKAGEEALFEAAVQQAVPLFQRSRGCHAMRLERGIESPSAYRLFVQWETLDDHVVHFRGSAEFTAWRELVGKHFAVPPTVYHTALSVAGF